MMETLSTLLVGRPFIILAVAVLFFAAFFLLGRSAFGVARQPRALLVPAVFWTFYAAWEWLVMIKTPEANIRVDLLVIWPVLLIVSIWFAIRAFRRADHS